MKIHHFAVYVEDLEQMKAFYETYFEATPGPLYHNPKTGLKTYFLNFADGGKLEIMARPEVAVGEKGLHSAGYIHLAVSVGGRERVDTLTDRLQKDGYTVVSGPRTTGDGYYESCILDPECNQIELVE